MGFPKLIQEHADDIKRYIADENNKKTDSLRRVWREGKKICLELRCKLCNEIWWPVNKQHYTSSKSQRCPCQSKRLRRQYNSYNKLKSLLAEKEYELLYIAESGREDEPLGALPHKYTRKMHFAVQCPNGHPETTTTCDDFLSGRECYYCGREKIKEKNTGNPGRSLRQIKKEFLIAEKEKNGYKYYFDINELKRAKDKLEFICCDHYVIFKQTLRGHLQSEGCSECRKENRSLGREFVIATLTDAYNDLWDYSQLPELPNTDEHYNFRHKLCGNLCNIKLGELLNIDRGYGCGFCDIEGRRMTPEEFKERANKLRIEAGLPLYGYEKITKETYKNNRTNVPIYCNCCYQYFPQTPDNHLRLLCGCPFCCRSKGEARVKKYLDDHNIRYKEQYKFGQRQRFDFFLPQYNSYIEYDGRQHYEPIDFFGGEEVFRRIQELDMKKNLYCHGKYPLLRIRWDEYDEVEEIMDDFMDMVREWKPAVIIINKYRGDLSVNESDEKKEELENAKYIHRHLYPLLTKRYIN